MAGVFPSTPIEFEVGELVVKVWWVDGHGCKAVQARVWGYFAYNFSPDDARELMQTTVEIVLMRLGDLQPLVSFERWLLGVARYLAYREFESNASSAVDTSYSSASPRRAAHAAIDLLLAREVAIKVHDDDEPEVVYRALAEARLLERVRVFS